MIDASNPSLGPRALAVQVLDVIERSDLTTDQVAAVDDALRRVVRSGRSDHWEHAACALWDRPEIFDRLDAVIGLRAQIRRARFATAFDAVTASLVRCVTLGRSEAPLFGLTDGLVWLPDMAIRNVIRDLEVGLDGVSAFWEEDPLVRDMIGADEGPHGLWQRYLRWAGAGEVVRNGWVAAPDYVGSFPAVGLPAGLPRLASVRQALRDQPRPGAFISTTTPALLPWTPAALPSLESLVLGARGGVHAAPVPLWTIAGHRALKKEDPQRALLVLLARTGKTSAAAALVDVIRRFLVHLAPSGTAGERAWIVRIPPPFIFPPLALARQGERLLCSVDGLAGLITWLGLVPDSFRPYPPFTLSWPYATLRACGWQLLETTRRWVRVRGFDTGEREAGLAEAIAFPIAPIPEEIPAWSSPLVVAHDSAPAQVGMDYQGLW